MVGGVKRGFGSVEKKKGKASSFALKRVRIFEPKLARAGSSEPALMAVKAIIVPP